MYAGRLQQPVRPGGERIVGGGRGVAEHAGQQPADRLGDDQDGDLAAGEHVVAEADLVHPHPRGRVLATTRASMPS